MPTSSTSSAPLAPPPPRRFERPPAPALPQEVLSLVIQFAVPQSSHPRAFSKRSKLLRHLALVSKSWRSAAQAELFHLVCLPLPPSAWKIIGSGMGKALGSRTKILKLGKAWERAERETTWHKYPASTAPVLRVMLFITELWLEEVTVDPAVLSWAQDLKTIHLHEVNLRLHKDRDYWHLPKLQTLFMTAVTVTSYADQFIPARPLFTPLTLPALTTLAWTWDNDNTDPDFELGPQLTHLFLHRTSTTSANDPTPRFPVLPAPLFTSLTSLQHLFLTIRFFLDIPNLDSIPSSLRSLHLWSIPGATPLVEAHLVKSGPKPRCLNQAEVFFVPRIPDDEMEMDEEGKEVEPEWRDNFRKWAGSTRVKEVEMEMDLDDAMDKDSMRWLAYAGRVPSSPPTTSAMTPRIAESTLNAELETAVTSATDEGSEKAEGEVAEQGKEASGPEQQPREVDGSHVDAAEKLADIGCPAAPAGCTG
ncbi:hypothetical protein BCR35DRAFT_351158 [Leucosporidium creatinivorum]|uniref:Uncharacterized protein n=1 Tax=Leucosporidium creatinivorum TaxID=106004 RepID=A0A1Y2FWG9_9BASI|nr:hypothetical protein BCR35DRAFT_351158 [Leucosporidium creatinivorum]